VITEPNFTEYSVPQLFEALESVDDLRFPTQAREILKRILERTALDKTELLSRYETSDLSMPLALVTGVGLDTVTINQNTHDKIIRILKQFT